MQGESSNSRTGAYLAPEPPPAPLAVAGFSRSLGGAGDLQLLFGLPVQRRPTKPLLDV